MNKPYLKILIWLPRILSIIFAIFLSLFALDVFSEGHDIWETVQALFIHLIPTYLVIIALIIAWHREQIGAILFIVLAIFFLFLSRGKGWIIAGPLILIGILFFLSWKYRIQITKFKS